MNPLGLMLIAFSAGCGAGLVQLLEGLRVARDAALPTAAVDEPADVLDATERPLWGGEFSELGKHLAKARAQRARVQADRAEKLHAEYLQQLENAVEEHAEVSAR